MKMSLNKSLLFILPLLLLVLQSLVVNSRVLPNPKNHFPNLLQSLEKSHKGQNLSGLHKLKQYLHKIGYYPNHANLTQDYFDDHLENSITTFQQYYHLNVTGRLSPETVKLISNGRFCGTPDHFVSDQTLASTNSSDKFHVHYSLFPGNLKWPNDHLDLAYGFPILTHFDKETLRPIIARAFERWQNISPLTFREYYYPVDILLEFETGPHHDNYPFDGPGGIVAHGFPPNKSDAWSARVHLDGDEPNWSVKDVPGPEEIDLETIAMHEIGHLIGIGHSTDPNAVMNPNFQVGVSKRELTHDDILAVDVLYGMNPS